MTTIARTGPFLGGLGVFLVAANVWSWGTGNADGAGPFWVGLFLIGAWRLITSTPTAAQLEHDPYLLSPGAILAAGAITVLCAGLLAMVLYGVFQVATASSDPLDQPTVVSDPDGGSCGNSSASCEVRG